MKQSPVKDGTSPPVTRFEDDVHFSASLSLRHADILIAALKDEAMLLHARAAREPEKSDVEQDLRRQANQRDAEADAIRDTMHKARRVGDVHTTRNEGCAVDQRHASGNSSIVQMESNKLLPWLMLTCLLSGVAIALSIFAIIRSSDGMRMSLLAREDVRVFDHALTAHGIDTDEHALEKGRQPK